MEDIILGKSPTTNLETVKAFIPTQPEKSTLEVGRTKILTVRAFISSPLEKFMTASLQWV